MNSDFPAVFCDKSVRARSSDWLLVSRRSWHVVTAACLSLLFAGCAGLPFLQNQDADPQEEVVADSEWIEGQGVEFHVLAGELAAKRGQVDQSARHYLEATKQSGDAAIAARATRLALYAEEEALALESAKAWLELVPDESSAREIAARLALRAGDQEEALLHLRKITQSHADGVDEGFRKVGGLLNQEQQKTVEAMAVMQALVAESPEVAGAHYGLAMLATRQGDIPLAESSISRALSLKPDWVEARLLQVGILLKAGDVDAADQSMKSVLAGSGKMIKYRLAYARLLLDAEQAALAKAQFLTVLEEQPRNTSALFALGLIELDEGELETSHDYFHRLYRTGIRSEEAAYYLGRIEEKRENFAEAQQWYSTVVNGSQAFDAAIRRAYMMFKQDELESAVKFLRKLRSGNPQLAVRLYLAEADILYEAKAFKRAMTLYNEALEKFPDEFDLLYGRSLIAERLGKVEQARADLTRIVEMNPDDARALNALGYILSNHTSEYDQALEYVQKALSLSPQDPAVIDSMGWVQFRLGNLDAALEYLTLAFDKMPDPEIAAHLGEVLWVTGEQQRAREVWDKALGKDPEHPVLKDTVKRLSQ